MLCGVAATLASCNVVKTKKLTNKVGTQAVGKEPPSHVAAMTMDEVKLKAQHIVTDFAPTVAESADSTKRAKREQLCHKATEEANAAMKFADQALASGTTTQPSLPKAELEAKARAHLATAMDHASEANIEKTVLYSPWFRAHAGAARRSPFALAKNAATGLYELKRAKRSTDFYAEVDFLNRVAWLEPSQRIQPSDVTGACPRLRAMAPHDLELKLGFINSDGSVDSSTRAAGGDWYTNASVGWNLLGYNISGDAADRDDPNARGTVNFEVTGDFITDRDGLRVTGSYYVGIGSAWAVPIDTGTKLRNATVFGGLYFGIHEYPRIDPDNVVYSSQERPTYMRLGTLAARVDFTIPLTQSLEIVVRGNLATPVSRYDLPDDWSLFVGASFPIGKLVRDILGSN